MSQNTDLLEAVIQDLESAYVRDAIRRKKSLLHAHESLLETVMEAAMKLTSLEQKSQTANPRGKNMAETETPKTITHAGLEWSETLLDGESVTYEAAEKAIAELGEGWRMPTRLELESILDLTREEPAVDTEKFPDTKSLWYWTSTPCAWDDAAVWVVDFGYGGVNYGPRGNYACVRAVRAGQ